MPIATDELADAAAGLELIDVQEVQDLRRSAGRGTGRFVDALAERCRVSRGTLYAAVAERRGLPFLDPALSEVDGQLVNKLSAALVRRRQVLPIVDPHGTVTVGTADPDDHGLRATIERALGQPVDLALADPVSLGRRIEAHFAAGGGERGLDEEQNATDLLDQVLREGHLARASDIHIDPHDEGYFVRIRCDGTLRPLFRVALASGTSLVLRIKVLAGLDIAEQRAAQDGSFQREVAGTALDLRVATVPSVSGEKATLRILEKSAEGLGLDHLGFDSSDRERFRRAIASPHGLILLTGPTGSGKSTTLYAALQEIDVHELNVLTVEDPVERRIQGVTQVQVGGSKVDFAASLRSLVRHDPDVLMVGEIRDTETAQVCTRASLTGHLVFSTLHTNDAPGAVARLVDLDIDRFTIASTLLAVIAQRLVKRLCVRCRRARETTTEERALLNGAETVHDAVGCALCGGTGYRGRIGVFQCFWIDAETREAILAGKSVQSGSERVLSSLGADARRKVTSGVTSLEEIARRGLLGTDEVRLS